MTIQVPQYLQKKSYPAKADRRLIRSMFNEGIMGASDYAGSTTGDIVNIGRGYAIVNSDTVDNGAYLVFNDATVGIPVGTRHSTLPRVDQVYLKVFDNVDEGDDIDSGQLLIAKGVENSLASLSNKVVSITTLPRNSLLLYYVLVPPQAGGQPILIEDGRVRAYVGGGLANVNFPQQLMSAKVNGSAAIAKKNLDFQDDQGSWGTSAPNYNVDFEIGDFPDTESVYVRAIARTTVSQNAQGTPGLVQQSFKRKSMNFSNTSNVEATLSEDTANDRTDISLTSRIPTYQNEVLRGTRRGLNFSSGTSSVDFVIDDSENPGQGFYIPGNDLMSIRVVGPYVMTNSAGQTSRKNINFSNSPTITWGVSGVDANTVSLQSNVSQSVVQAGAANVRVAAASSVISTDTNGWSPFIGTGWTSIFGVSCNNGDSGANPFTWIQATEISGGSFRVRLFRYTGSSIVYHNDAPAVRINWVAICAA